MHVQRMTERVPPRALVVIVYAGLACAALIVAYWMMFSVFAPYDDEGTLLVDLLGFVHGHVLYRDIYSQYGPFYFELFGGLFALTGKAISTDAGRFIVVCIWTLLTVVLAVIGHRLTGRLAVGVATAAVGFRPLGALVPEPMHPAGLGALLIGVITLLVVIGPGRRPRLSGALLGLALAGLLMTKINLGVFALAAVALALALATPAAGAMRWLRRLIVAGCAVTPLLLIYSSFDQAWARDLIVIATSSIVAIIVTATALPPPSQHTPQARSWVLAGVAALIAGVVAMIVAILPTGTTVGDIYDGIVRQAARGQSVFVAPLGLRDPDTVRALVGLTAAVATAAVVRRTNAGTGLSSGALRLGAGLIIWALVGGVSLFPQASVSDALVLPMALAWIAALPVRGKDEDWAFRVVRAFLPALAVFEVLQVYPVAGSQSVAAQIWFVPVGALCIGDGIKILSSRGVATPQVFRIAATGLAGLCAWAVVIRPGISAGINYYRTPALPLNGAHLVHLDPSQGDVYTRLAYLVHDRCTAFVGYPSFNSLYLWSGINPPRESLPGGWMTLVGNRRQARVVSELQHATRPCEVRDDPLAAFWINGQANPRTPVTGPLVSYLANNFRLAAQVGDYQLLVARPRSG
jgi:hypothetical protein